MITRITAILKLEYYTFIRALEHITDVLVYPVISIIVFGYLSLFLVGNSGQETAHAILMGIVLWQVIFIVQYSIAVGALWNIWWRNLSNLFVTPLSITEFFIAVSVISIIKAIIIFLLGAFFSEVIFHFSMFAVGIPNLILFLLNLFIFATSFGIIVTGLIFRYGTRIQALAWGSLPLLQPLTAAFYPVSVLPKLLQPIAYLFPPTYIFEAMRMSLRNTIIHWELILPAFCINVIFFLGAVFFFRVMFHAARNTGQFARNEG